MASISVEARAPTQEPQELYMLSKRDNVEKDRLDDQSNLIKLVRGGHALDPSIPKSQISRIADVATGTGVWLREATAELSSHGSPLPLSTVGFDISPDQFPLSPGPGASFVVWNAVNPFPEEYRSSFDLVHVRLLTVAVTIPHIKLIAKNLVDLIKPGGYLQWTDWTYTNGLDVIYPPSTPMPSELSLKDEGREMYEFHGAQGFSYDTTGDVARALGELETVEWEVRVTGHTGAARERPEIRGLVVEWHSRVIPLFMEMMATRKGESKEGAARIAEEYKEKAVAMGEKGTVFEVPITTLVARKKTE